VISLFKGEIGQPVGGFDPDLQSIILKDQPAFTNRPNEHLQPVDFDAEFESFRTRFGDEVRFTDLLSWLLYPKVFEAYYEKRKEFGEVWHIPTINFFYGLKDDEEALVEIDKGKSILVRLLTCSETDENGIRKVFMRLNGQTRIVEIRDKKATVTSKENRKADPSNAQEVGAPLQGKLSQLLVKEGQEVAVNQPLFVIEAMKMETTITAVKTGKVNKIFVEPGDMVKPEDLVICLD
jgi:pyruvate carboxylase